VLLRWESKLLDTTHQANCFPIFTQLIISQALSVHESIPSPGKWERGSGFNSRLYSGSHALRGYPIASTLCFKPKDAVRRGQCVPVRSMGTRDPIALDAHERITYEFFLAKSRMKSANN
jgi:hypothetical protein